MTNESSVYWQLQIGGNFGAELESRRASQESNSNIQGPLEDGMPTRRILVVDDEPAVLRLVDRALSVLGYEVCAAASPGQALHLVDSEPCFDLVVSDVIMPEMCGPELVRRIARMCPHTEVVLMSAHIAAEALPDGAAFISKPFELGDLKSVVENKLRSSMVHSTSPMGGTG